MTELFEVSFWVLNGPIGSCRYYSASFPLISPHGPVPNRWSNPWASNLHIPLDQTLQTPTPLPATLKGLSTSNFKELIQRINFPFQKISHSSNVNRLRWISQVPDVNELSHVENFHTLVSQFISQSTCLFTQLCSIAMGTNHHLAGPSKFGSYAAPCGPIPNFFRGYESS